MLPGPARQPVPQAPPKSTVLPEIPATPAGIPDVPAVAPQIPAMPAMIPDVAPAAPQNPALTPPAEAPAIQQTDPSGAGVPPKTPMEAEIDPASPQIRLTLPEDFVKQSALFCQKQIGQWKIADARELLGEPVRQRPAYEDDQKTVSGTIHAFSDPSGRYKELELDFDSLSGVLRSVFVYPPRMTWEECRRLWGGDVTSADAHQGRNFYSYLNRRLDVLVDQTGKVISLGLY